MSETTTAGPLAAEELARLDAYWRAANYLSVGQIYLLDNPLLREPLRLEHVKPRLLGHWGTTPGLNLLYAHMNRVIRERDLDAIYITGPGHGGPGARRQRLPRGHLQRGLPDISRTRRACGGCSASSRSRAASPATSRPRRPGSIHEGGELGYALVHAYGAAFDNPDLLVLLRRRRRRGRDRARSPRAGTRTSSSTRSRDGAVLPILHLNGYKIANPTVLARIPEDELRDLLRGLRPRARASSRATSPRRCTRQLAAALDASLDEIARDPAPRARGRRPSSARAGR